MKKTPAPTSRPSVATRVARVVADTPACDIHTHLYDPAFGGLLLWGIDDLLVYHYLVAESFRRFEMPSGRFWALSKTAQADAIWKALFIEHSPISEACRGVLTTLNLLGLDVRKRDLPAVRKWFARWTPEDYTTRCMELANVRSICMTNSPFDDLERPLWLGGFRRDERFTAALRIDPLLLAWKESAPRLAQWGYNVSPTLSARTISETRRFLADWSRRMKAKFLMVSLPPDFAFPAKTEAAQLIERAVLPHCRESGLPFALMPGVKRAVNPALGLAGDGMGRADLTALANLCAAHPENRFLATVLSRENQHELCVLARKFRNLHIFGCWWFTNVPSIIGEMTRMRVELLGTSFTAQHSDARVLDQIIYKWRHSREILTRVLSEKYTDLEATGWRVSDAEMARDVRELLGGSYEQFCG
jgi:hypothetical protein